MAKIDTLFKMMQQQGASDLHISTGAPPILRLHGEMVRVKSPDLTNEQARALLFEILDDEQIRQFEETRDLDFAYAIPGVARFRGNILDTHRGIAGVFRLIPSEILTAEQLNLPEGVLKMTRFNKGLVLVTGPTGSGKSTTLAAMIDLINRTRKEHILTLEDPLEFVHENKLSLLNQRQIGTHSDSFASALKAALREDPDIILVGEMRDVETIDTALHAAETGHLVLSTLHTLDAKETINRTISVFPPEDQNRVRHTLASVLQGVLSQRLVKTVDGGRTAAVEILFNTSYIQKLILEKRDMEIKDALDEGTQIHGTQSFDTALLKLYKKGKISLDEALSNATSPNDLKLRIEGMETDVDVGQGRSGVYISEDDADIYGLKED
jgi:twitching motility protein PilT